VKRFTVFVVQVKRVSLKRFRGMPTRFRNFLAFLKRFMSTGNGPQMKRFTRGVTRFMGFIESVKRVISMSVTTVRSFRTLWGLRLKRFTRFRRASVEGLRRFILFVTRFISLTRGFKKRFTGVQEVQDVLSLNFPTVTVWTRSHLGGELSAGDSTSESRQRDSKELSCLTKGVGFH
jgi:hypothetical protein